MGGMYETPAVVVGLNPTALGVVRSLAPHCARVVALESDAGQPALHTRLCQVRRLDDLADPDLLLNGLRALAGELDLGHGDPPVLFVTTDEHVMWAVERRDELTRHFRLLMPERGVCADLMLKDRFLAMASRQGWPVPKSAFIPLHDLIRSIETAGLRYPVILKPAMKTWAWERSRLAKAFIVNDPDEAGAVVARAAGIVTDLLAQEYLDGDDGQVYFCLYLAAPGLAPVTFCGRKLLQWPPHRGSTAVCEPVRAPALDAFTRDMFGGLRIDGFASLEVKCAPDGSFRIIEPTIGRVDLQSSIATLNGMNMPLVAYLATLGRSEEARVFAQPVRHDVAWMHEPALWNLWRAHAIDRATLLALARREKGFALASWTDPFVLGALAGQKLGAVAKRAWAMVGGD